MDERQSVEALIDRLVRESNVPTANARDELRRELRSHFEESGDSPEAIRAALQRFGNAHIVSAAFQNAYSPGAARRGRAWLEHVGRDVHHAWRTIARMPGLVAVVVLSLGAGIGVNTTVFSWIQAILMRPLPGVQNATAFHLIEPRTEAGSYPGSSWPEYRDLRDRTRTFRDLLAYKSVPFNVGEESRTERSYGQLVSGNYFSALGLRPTIGRFLTTDEALRPGGDPVVVISHGYWQTRLAGASNVLGRALRVNGRDLTIIGVAPERFQGTVVGLTFDLWVPATLTPVLLGSRELDDRAQRGYFVMGKLRPGATTAHANADVAGVMRELGRLYPESNATMASDVRPFWRAPRGPPAFLLQGLALLQGVMLLLLLAVCGNTATLVLARASARQREIGVRRALGAGRMRIVSLLLTENVLLAIMGAALGGILAVWGTNALRAVPFPGGLPIRFQTSVDATGLGFAGLLGLLCGLTFGAAPALQLARLDPHSALRSGASREGRNRVRGVLIASEVALALVVLVVAGLFWRRLGDARETNPGFRRDGVLLAAYDLTGRGGDTASNRAFAARVLERVRSVPGVEAASIALMVPLDIHGMPSRSFTLEGRARDDRGQDQALYNVVTPGYFKTIDIPFIAGGDFADLRETAAPPQAIVNEAFVRRYLVDAEPLGRQIQMGSRSYVIVGVVRNSLYESFGERPKPIVHASYRDRPSSSGQIHLRTRLGAEATLAADLRRVVREIDPSLPLYDVRTLAEHVDRNLVFQRIPARMFVVLGPMLLVLTAIGIYAVVAYTVARRTTEIGVRIALGATGRNVITHMVRDVLRVVAGGAALGWLVAFMVELHVARGRPMDVPVLMGVPALLLLVATFACWLPARRAARVDPVVALRQE